MAAVVAVVAWSALSERATAVCRSPDVPEEMRTATVTGASGAPAAIGAAVEMQVSTRLPPLRAQVHPVTDGAETKVSPEGRLAVRVGSLYAGPPADPIDPPRPRL